jgi:hypothetical protein
MKTLIVSKTALTVATVAFGAALSLPAAVIDFSTDPNLVGDWTEYVAFETDKVAATWKPTDQDLGFVSTAEGGASSSVIGLYSNGSSRSTTESVTMTVNALDRTAGGWGFVGLMISAAPQAHNYIFGTTDSYTLRMNAGTNDGTFQFAVWRTVADGVPYDLFTGTSQTFSGSYVLDIERNGAGEYEFFANDALLYTTTAATTGADFYDATAKDSLLNYQIVIGSDGAMTATVDNFGVIPEPGTYALLGGLFALSFVMVRRRR